MREDTFRWVVLLLAVSLTGYLSGSRWQQPLRAAAREHLVAQQALDSGKEEQKAALATYEKNHEEVFEAQARALDMQGDLRSLHEAELEASNNGKVQVDAQVGRLEGQRRRRKRGLAL